MEPHRGTPRHFLITSFLDYFHIDFDDEAMQKAKNTILEAAAEEEKQKVTYDDNANTVTVETNKLVGEQMFSFVSVSPT